MFGFQPKQHVSRTKSSGRGRLRVCSLERLEPRELLSAGALTQAHRRADEHSDRDHPGGRPIRRPRSATPMGSINSSRFPTG